MTHTEEKTFKQSLKALSVDPKNYILPKDLKAAPGKNIIVISVESLEQGFFSKSFDNLVPYLKKYSEEWTFFRNMPIGPGSGWTAGSLFTHQVGLPAFVNMEDKSFKSKNDSSNGGAWANLLFQGTRDNKLVGVGNILNKAGYDYKYLMGNIEFAGIKDLLKSYGYKTISQKNSIGKYKPILMGLNDLDLFNEAKLQIDDLLLKNKDKPFALFMSTINTHFPIGIYDKRMEQYVSKKENSLEFSIASVDYLIHDFVEYLKKKKLLKNTAIFIFPDHLLMGRGGEVHKKLAMQDRKLYLLTNIGSDQFEKKTSDTVYQVDLPRLIIDGAEIKTNAKFFFDLLNVNDKIKFIEDNNIKITTLNASAIAKKSFNDKIEIELKDNKIYIKSGKNEIISTIKNKNILYDYMFSKDMVLLNEQEQPYNNNTPKANRDDIYYKLLHLHVKIKDNRLNMVYFGNKQNIDLNRYPANKKVTFSKEEVKNIISSHNKKMI
jgi:phosphoglycerol transferase